MKVKTKSIDSITGEVSVEEWDLPAFGPERLAQAWKRKHDLLQRPDPANRVKVVHWDYDPMLHSEVNAATFVVKESVACDKLVCVATGLAWVVS